MLKNRTSRQTSLSAITVAISSIALLSITGCVTPNDNLPRRNPVQKTPLVAPAAPGKETSRPAAGIAPFVLAPVPDSQIADFASRHALSVAGLSEADEQLLNRMPNQPPPASIQEAAMALGIVKTFNPVNTDSTTFSEHELNSEKKNEDEKPKKLENTGLGLEKAALARGLDLPGALEINPFLQSASVVRLINLAAEKGGNSEAFMKRLRAAMVKQAGEWRILSDRYGPDLAVAPKPAPSVTPISIETAAPTGDAARAIIEGTGRVSDLHSSDLVINNAAQKADEGQFDKAIETLKRVEKDSPLYKLSQEKTQEFSNAAVRDMRRKAAQAFSAANQANDSGTKGSYLEKAKLILEDALKKYPDADQLGTVRENLTVINRDLDRLHGSSAQRR